MNLISKYFVTTGDLQKKLQRKEKFMNLLCLQILCNNRRFTDKTIEKRDIVTTL